MKTLFMIRHSLTEGNVRRLYYGSTDLPLVDSGIELCHSLRGSYALPKNVSFATSGMLRAEQTLSELFGDVPHEIYPDLREMEMGIFEMKSYDQLKDTAAYQRWLSESSGETPIPEGESNRQVAERVQRCIRSLSQSETENLFIVCHGGVIGSAMTFAFPDAGKSFYDWIPAACHGYAIDFENGKPAAYRPI